MKGKNVTFVSELSKTNTLLSLTTVVMCGYQSLCPSLYAQVDFGLHRLLPPLNASHQLDEDSPIMAHEVLLPSLQLLLDAPQDGMKRLVGGARYEPCLSVWGQMGGRGGGYCSNTTFANTHSNSSIKVTMLYVLFIFKSLLLMNCKCILLN